MARKFLMIASVAVLGVSLAACGISETHASSTSSRHVISIGATIQDTAEAWYGPVQIGMQAAAKKYDAKLIITNDNNSVQTEADNIDTLEGDGVKAIAITPINSTSSEPAITRARSHKIAIITYNNTLANTSLATAQVKFGSYKIGYLAGEQAGQYINKNLKNKSVNIAMDILPGYPPLAKRVAGFKAALKSYPNVHYVARGSFNGTTATAYSSMEEMLTGKPSINMIFAESEGASDGALQAVTNLHRSSNVAIFGTDLDAITTKALETPGSPIKAMIQTSPYSFGYEAVKLAVDAIRHVHIPHIVTVHPSVVTPRNIKAYIKAHAIGVYTPK